MTTVRIKPGTRIRLLLRRFGITDNGGCGCTALANQMDKAGPEAVLENLDTWTEEMYISIKKWRQKQEGKTILVVQPPKITVRKLITWACTV